MLLPSIDRSVVYWFGPPPSAEEIREFSNRGLTVKIINSGETSIDYRIARGAVFCCKYPQIPGVCAQIGLVETALNHGLMVYLLAADDSTQGLIGELVTESLLTCGCKGAIRRRTGIVPAFELAETMARYPIGPAANDALEIWIPPDVELTEAQRFLLQRAFADCRSISLKKLTGGRSALSLLIQATLRVSEAGPRPLPYFVKLDEPEKIRKECDCYDQYATQHIPWYLRPNLQPARHVVGTTHSILVGSFVEQSESLWEAVQKGRGVRYIHALFEDTLLGWRSQAYRTAVKHGNFADELRDVYQYQRIRPEHVVYAERWGSVLSPQALWQQLLNLPEQNWRHAPMHGDMHGENVRVRNNDAIIIDLAKTRLGPLSADLASLDVWLAFEVPGEGQSRPDTDLWARLVEKLYRPSDVGRPPREELPDTGIEWLRASIATIRMIANSVQESDFEYAMAVALYLLRRAQYPARGADVGAVEEDARRRAYAYHLGARLAGDLSRRAEETPR